MALVLSETFTTEIPAGFATIFNDTGTLTVTYNGTEQSADLSKGGYNSFWRLDTTPIPSQLRIILDIEVTLADNGGSSTSSFGFGFSYSIGSPVYFMAVTTSTDNLLFISSGSVASPYASAVSLYSKTNSNVSGRRTYEYVISHTTHNSVCFVMKDSGVELSRYYFNPVAANWNISNNIVPYIFIRDCNIRVHSIEIHDDVADHSLNTFTYDTGNKLEPIIYLTTQPFEYTFDSNKLEPITYLINAPIKSYIYTTSIMTISNSINVGKIYGTLKIEGAPDTPVRRKARLYNEKTGALAGETWSLDGTGYYEFLSIDLNERYSVVAYDYENIYNAVIASNRIPVSV